MKILDKLIDAAGALVVATAVLCLWGYVYYAGYTEKLGVPFHGIPIPPQEYITASWFAAVVLLVATLAVALLVPIGNQLMDKAANLLRRKLGKSPLQEARASNAYSPFVVLFLSVGAILGGI